MSSLAITLAGPAVSASGQAPPPGSQSLGEWTRRVQDVNELTAVEAASAIGRIAETQGASAAGPAIPALVAALGDPRVPVRRASAEALGALGPEGAAAVAPLVQLARADADTDARRTALAALSRISPADPSAVAVAVGVLSASPEVALRRAAAALLVASGEASDPVRAAIRQSRLDPDATVRLYAAAALARNGEPQAIGTLREGLGHEDPGVRAEAAVLLGTLDESEATVSALTAALNDVDPAVRVASADALAEIGGPARSALRPLWRLIRDPVEQVREHALRAIRVIRDEL